MVSLPRVVIAAPGSGHGKTTVATGLLKALAGQGVRVAGFKVGPDYIDPSYHELACGLPGRNLDPVLVGEDRVAPLFVHGAASADVCIVEGVMGLFDGRVGQGDFGSTAHVAGLLDAPVILVVDASGQGRSLAALLHGFRTFAEQAAPRAPRHAATSLDPPVRPASAAVRPGFAGISRAASPGFLGVSGTAHAANSATFAGPGGGLGLRGGGFGAGSVAGGPGLAAADSGMVGHPVAFGFAPRREAADASAVGNPAAFGFAPGRTAADFGADALPVAFARPGGGFGAGSVAGASGPGVAPGRATADVGAVGNPAAVAWPGAGLGLSGHGFGAGSAAGAGSPGLAAADSGADVHPAAFGFAPGRVAGDVGAVGRSAAVAWPGAGLGLSGGGFDMGAAPDASGPDLGSGPADAGWSARHAADGARHLAGADVFGASAGHLADSDGLGTAHRRAFGVRIEDGRMETARMGGAAGSREAGRPGRHAAAPADGAARDAEAIGVGRMQPPGVWIAGVILNRVGSDRHEQVLREACAEVGMPVLGVLRRSAPVAVPSRHLGLVPVAERTPEAVQAVEAMASLVAGGVDLSAVLAIAHSAPPLKARPWSPPVTVVRGRPTVAVAGGAAFSFGYREQLELLAATGAEVAFFDPLRDEKLPDGTAAVVVNGGFPEVYGEQLAANEPLRRQVRELALSGAPVVAECAGLLWLGRMLDGHEMCGVLDSVATMTDRLTLGYRDAVAVTENVLTPAGTRVTGHEFHRTHTTPECGPRPAWSGASGGFVQGGVHASYLHTHWAGYPEFAQRLVETAAASCA